MKYIRTKDRIVDISNYEKAKDCFFKKINNLITDIINIKYDIIKQADTIEELCDCFIAIGEKGTICAFKTFSELKHYDYTIPNEKLVKKYGAIHITDKGLIYVSKMNEKGELELL